MTAIDAQMAVCESVLFAVIIRSLAVEASRRSPTPNGITAEESEAASCRAARFGAQGDLVSLPTRERAATPALAHQLLDTVEDRLENFGDADYVATGLRNLLDAGNRAARQRKSLTKGGIDKIIETAGTEFVTRESFRLSCPTGLDFHHNQRS